LKKCCTQVVSTATAERKTTEINICVPEQYDTASILYLTTDPNPMNVKNLQIELGNYRPSDFATSKYLS